MEGGEESRHAYENTTGIALSARVMISAAAAAAAAASRRAAPPRGRGFVTGVPVQWRPRC